MASTQEQETKDAAATAAASGQGPPPEELAQAIEAAKTAASFQDAADALKKQASLVWDPAEREKLLKSAYLKEKAAHGESKKARGEWTSSLARLSRPVGGGGGFISRFLKADQLDIQSWPVDGAKAQVWASGSRPRLAWARGILSALC